MPLIMPIKELRNTTEISNIAHKQQEPIFSFKKTVITISYNDSYSYEYNLWLLFSCNLYW